MRVTIRNSEAGLTATLTDRDDFETFAVVLARAISVEPGASSVDGAVRFEDSERAWVDQGWLRTAGRFAEDEVAAANFGQMLEYAVEHGWIDPETDAVAAHVERVD